MKKILILSLFLITSISINSFAQDFDPFEQNSWITGIGGNMTFDESNGEYAGGNQKYEVSDFSWTLDLTFGRFVLDNLAVGFNVMWENRDRTIQPVIDNNGDEISDNRKFGYMNVWTRYYFVLSKDRVAVYPEISIGYAKYKEENSEYPGLEIFQPDNEAAGYAYTAGAGITYFIIDHIAFDAVARYETGDLTTDLDVETEDSSFDYELSRFNILFGLNIYF